MQYNTAEPEATAHGMQYNTSGPEATINGPQCSQLAGRSDMGHSDASCPPQCVEAGSSTYNTRIQQLNALTPIMQLILVSESCCKAFCKERQSAVHP